MPPQLQTVEQVLPDDVKCQEHGRQRLQVGVGHPDAHGGVLLPKELTAGHGVAVTVPEPLAEAELHCAHYRREDSAIEDNMLVPTTLQEDIMDGVAQRDEQRDRPKVKGEIAVLAKPVVHFGCPQLQCYHEKERKTERGGDALQNHQERLPEGEFRVYADDREIERRDHRHHQVAEHGVGGGRHAVGAEHRGDDHHRRRHRTERAHHEPLCHRLVARNRPHQQI